jgi:flagellar hook protein FlgE
MLNSLNTGVSGLQQFQSQIDSIGNNIANVNTTGYKSARLNFADTFGEALAGSSDGSVSSSFGSGVTSDGITTSFRGGTIMSTDNVSDLAIRDGEGFFTVKDAATGDTYATRAGNFKLDNEGYLITQQGGLRVQGRQGAGQAVGDLYFRDVAANRGGFDPQGASYIQTEVTQDGSIMIHFDNGSHYKAGQIMLTEYAAPQELTKLGGNLYGNLEAAVPGDADGEVPGTGNVGSIQSYALEKSNVDLTGEFSSLIVAQRAFQANARMISTSDELLQELVNLTR